MNRLERLGTEMAMLIRRQADCEAELNAIQMQMEAIRVELLKSDTKTLYADTGTMPAVGDDRPTEQFTQDVPCPGPDYCNWSRLNRIHAHTADGQIWDIGLRTT